METVFQAPVTSMEHNSYVIRTTILNKYGGVYMDFDVFWTNPLPQRSDARISVLAQTWVRFASNRTNLDIFMITFQ